MSSIIGFLERMGGDSQLRHAGREELARALGDVDIEPMLLAAVLSGDLAMLESTLQIDRPLCCLVYTPKEDDKEEEEEREDDGEGDDEGDNERVPEDAPRP